MARVEPSEPRESDLRMNAWLLPLQQEISSTRREKETLRSEKETLRKENETLQQRKLQLLKQRSQLLQQKNKNNEPNFLELRRRFSVRGSRSDRVLWREVVLVSHPKETAD